MLANTADRVRRLARRAPYASAALTVLVGLYTGWLGWEGIRHGHHTQASFWAMTLPA